MESCKLLVRWSRRIRKCTPYCSRLRSRSGSTVLCSSSARLGSTRRVSGVRSGEYSVYSAAPTLWSCARGGRTLAPRGRGPGMWDARGAAAVKRLRSSGLRRRAGARCRARRRSRPGRQTVGPAFPGARAWPPWLCGGRPGCGALCQRRGCR